MAKNLRNKIATTDTMLIHDVNPAVTKAFADELGNVKIANSVREIAENTVRWPRLDCDTPAQDEHLSFPSMYDLSWRRKPLL